MDMIEQQKALEYKYSTKHIDKMIRQYFEREEILSAKIEEGVQLLKAWLKEGYYESKDIRLAQVMLMDLKSLVTEIFTGITYCLRPELFVSVTSQMASRLQFDDKRDSIATVAEMIAVLCQTDVFNINRYTANGSFYVVSNLIPDQALLDAIQRSVYLPPMVCEPADIESNYESPYLTFHDCQILGREACHDKEICLDVLNIQNKVPLALNCTFLDRCPEEATHDLDTIEKQQLWDQFKAQSADVYKEMIRHGNRFYIPNKPDTRGRIYSQGYHINPQGTAYKKAMLQLADTEVIQGVPSPSQAS